MNDEHKSTSNSNSIDITLMKKLLDDNFYFDFLKKGVLNNYRSFPISKDVPEELLYVTEVGNPIDVLNIIKTKIESGNLKLDKKQKANYNYLLNSISVNSFVEDYKNKFFITSLNGKILKVPCGYFIDFLTLPDKDFDAFFNDDVKSYKEYDKKDFMYLFMNFIRRELLYKKYIFKGKYKKRLDDIFNCERLDVEYLYYSNPKSIKYENLEDLKLTDELKNEILKDMSDNLNPIKKAIYIYIKLCKTLTYDPEFYALGQGLNGVEKHRNINNIEFITPSNNEAICYEFCAIYAKFIKELGFDYELDGDPLGMMLGKHQYLKTLLGKYFVSIDSVTSVLYGDMTRSKLNQPLEGINCLNKSTKSKNEFNLMITEMYSLIVNQEKNKKEDYTNLTFDKLFKQNKNDDIKNYTFVDKIKLLLKKANEYNLKTIDLFGYIKQLISVLFTTNEKENNVKFSVISDKKRVNKGKDVTISGVFTIMEGEKTFYLLFNADEGLLISLSIEDLDNLFKKDELSYIDKQSTKIPGIDTNISIK